MEGKRVLFIGRFQPFHLGHLGAVEWLLDRFEEVVVCIGMASESFTWRNPFTAGERLLMIRWSLLDEGVDWSRIITVTAPTLEVGVQSFHYMLSLSPPVDAVATANPVVRMIAGHVGVRCVCPPLLERERLRGSVVRRLMATGGDWRSLVPRGTARVVEEVGGVERLRRLYRVVSSVRPEDSVYPGAGPGVP